jgi:hypothetical protein
MDGPVPCLTVSLARTRRAVANVNMEHGLTESVASIGLECQSGQSERGSGRATMRKKGKRRKECAKDGLGQQEGGRGMPEVISAI